MTEQRKVLFCLSYLEIPEVLTLISHFDCEYAVITSNDTVHHFFMSILDSARVIKIDPSPSLRTRSPIRLAKNLLKLLSCKKDGLTQVSGYLNSDVYYFGVAYCEFETWLAAKISEGSKLFYKPAVDMSFMLEKKSLYATIVCNAIKAIYTVTTVPLWKGNGYSFSVERFLKSRANYVPLQVTPDHKAIQDVIKIQVENKEVLILLGGEAAGGLIGEKEFSTRMDKIFDLLIDRFGLDALVVKFHPTFEPKDFPIKQIQIIPKHIPARILMPAVKTVIAYSSKGLCEATDEGKTAISLLKLIEPANISARDKYIQYLVSNSSREILFPSTFEELLHAIEPTR